MLKPPLLSYDASIIVNGFFFLHVLSHPIHYKLRPTPTLTPKLSFYTL